MSGAQFAKDVIPKITTTILERLQRKLELIGDVGHNVAEVVGDRRRLLAWRDYFENSLRKSRQRTRPDQVENWFKRVVEVEQEVTKIQQDYNNRCLCAGYCSPNIFSSYSISRRAVEKRDDVRQLLEDYDRIKNLEGKSPPASCIQKPLPAVLVGKRSCLAEALGYLDDENVGIVSICGMAGVGKSTLMRCINNEFLAGTEKGEYFEFVIWVDASSSDVKKLQDDIATRLGLDDLGPWEEDEERRARPIFNVLKNRTFLLLLDNLTTLLNLAGIGVPNPKHHHSTLKQKVVLSTRSKGVCGGMGSCRRIDMGCFDWEETWKLFEATVGEGTIGDVSIKDIAEQIARECGGLPLALTKIGGPMATKRDSADWIRTAEFLKSSQVHRIPGMEKNNTAMLQVIRGSYDRDLPDPAVRRCFLCCSLWPRGCSIDKNELIDCWIGLGLIKEASPVKAARAGFSIISCLQEANLLLPGDNADREVRLHHVVRDMALWTACDCGEKESENKWLVQAGVGLRCRPKLIELLQRAATTEWLSLMRNSIQWLPSAHLCSCPSLAVLMLQHNPSLGEIPAGFLGKAPALTYLDLSYTAIRELPEEIGTLALLQYLNLSSTKIVALPKELGNLAQIKHLLLRNTNELSTIPAGLFWRMVSLQVLDMYPSRYMDWEGSDAAGVGGNETIASFNQMDPSTTFIQSLGITISAFHTLQTLARLYNVCTRRLRMTRFDSPRHVILCPSQLMELMRSFSLLETLLEMSITDCPALEELVFDSEEEDGKRNDSWRVEKLETLELCGLSNLSSISWKSMSVPYFLPALQHVKIEGCHRLKDVSWVVGLLRLEHLELRHCHGMMCVLDHHEPQDTEGKLPAFGSLTTLVLVDLPCLCSICGPKVRFPWLEVIEVGRCGNLRQLNIRPQDRLREIRGTAEWWRGLDWESTDGVASSLQPYFVETNVE